MTVHCRHKRRVKERQCAYRGVMGGDKTKLGLNVGCGPPVARTWADSGWTEEEADAADTDTDSNADIFKQKTAPSALHFCLNSQKI